MGQSIVHTHVFTRPYGSPFFCHPFFHFHAAAHARISHFLGFLFFIILFIYFLFIFYLFFIYFLFIFYFFTTQGSLRKSLHSNFKPNFFTRKSNIKIRYTHSVGNLILYKTSVQKYDVKRID